MGARGSINFCFAGRARLDRRRRYFFRARQFFRGLFATWTSRMVGRKTRRALRDRCDPYEEMDHGRTNSGAARRAGNTAASAAHLRRRRCSRCGAPHATGAGFIVNNREMPDICLQHLVALMLLDRTGSFKAAHDRARMQDPAVLRAAAKVESRYWMMMNCNAALPAPRSDRRRSRWPTERSSQRACGRPFAVLPRSDDARRSEWPRRAS